MSKMTPLALVLLAVVYPCPAADNAAPIDKAWYTPHDLLPLIAQRADISWAMPETLTGLALVGGDAATIDALLDQACKQWGLAKTRINSVVVIHRADDERLQKWVKALRRGDEGSPRAAWELGWLRDGRALPALAEALAGKDTNIALASAQAIQTLDTGIPLGRTDRVDAPLRGRVSLARAFTPKADLTELLDSPHPAVRAAALRLLLGQGGKLAEAAKIKTADDLSPVVRDVRQQMLWIPGDVPNAGSKLADPAPLPKDPAHMMAACAKMMEELPGLEKQSEWEKMRWRVRTMADWSRRGQTPATEALLELTGTKMQQGWFPGYAQMYLASTGSEPVVAKIKEILPKANRATLCRGLEKGYYGNALLAFTRPYLDDQTLCYVTARKAGREAYDDLLALASRGNWAAIDALGAIGGQDAVAVLKTQLAKGETQSATLAFRSAKALGLIGTTDALDALLAATADKDRLRRHAATLFLGRIGGSKAVTRLLEVLDKEPDRMVRAAAADALEQIGGKENLSAVSTFRKTDAALPESVYLPRNARFGPDFPVNEWVNLKVRIQAFSEFGEMGWAYDPANRVFLRYGGCSGYHNELTLFDLGTEQFIQRRPNEKMAGWGDRRTMNGCSAGRCWDPYGKVLWIGPSIGATDPNLATFEYYNKDGGFRFCSYDVAADRFRPAPKPMYATRYAMDWKSGLLMPIKFTHPNHLTKDFWAFDVRTKTWLDRKTPGEYPRDQNYTTAAMDRDAGLLVLYVAPHGDHPAETWTYDPASNIWKNVQPKVQPPSMAGAGFAYDPFHKVLVLQSGKKVSQYGGPDDSITWSYDVRTNTWKDLQAKSGPGNPWVGAMDYDPEHNVFVLFNYRDKQVWAYRHQAVETGMKAK